MRCAICCLLSVGPVAPDPAANAPVNAPVSPTVVTAATAMARTETGAPKRGRPLGQRAICIFLNLAMGMLLLLGSNGCVRQHGPRRCRDRGTPRARIAAR